jgi:site-specific DNA-methyltransferase (adenine-specific)
MNLGEITCGDNLAVMRDLPEACCDLIYADPPFFTGKSHNQRNGEHQVRDCWPGGLGSYLDFLRPRLAEMRRLLKPTGMLYLHLDWHALHYAKVLLDELFGYDHFVNEIIWSYRTGGASTRWFPRKHDTLLVYARVSGQQKFHPQRGGQFRTDGLKYDETGRPFKSTRNGPLYFHPDGPAITDVWELPFLSTVSLERTGYPTQKPEALLERVIVSGTDPGDVVGDFFCGSGTTLATAKRLGRRWIGCDASAEAVKLARGRLEQVKINKDEANRQDAETPRRANHR